MRAIFTTSEMAELAGTDTWRVRRLFEDGTLPEPDRFAGRRAIPRESLPAIIDALRARGWLPQASVGHQGVVQCGGHDGNLANDIEPALLPTSL